MEKIIEIPKNFPSKCSDEELAAVIESCVNAIFDAGANTNVVMRFGPIINLGQSEQQKRAVGQLYEITEKNLKISDDYNLAAKEYNSASKRFSIIALIIAMVSLGVSFYFSFRSDKENSAWRLEETQLLKELLKE